MTTAHMNYIHPDPASTHPQAPIMQCKDIFSNSVSPFEAIWAIILCFALHALQGELSFVIAKPLLLFIS